MKESQEKVLVFAVCEDKMVHRFGAFSENSVGDDIYGSYQVGTEIGSYCYTPEKAESNGMVSAIPDPVILQSYLKGESNEELDNVCNTLEINNKIKAFYWISTDDCRKYDDILFARITAAEIEFYNDENKIYTPVPNIFLRMLLIDADLIEHTGSASEFNSLFTSFNKL